MTRNSSFNDVQVKSKNITLKRLKKVSFVFISLATLILILDIISLKMVFGKTEVGLWDQMPVFFRRNMFFFYTILLVISFMLFAATKKIKSKFDFVINILFLLNGFAVLLLLVIFAIELVKNL